MLVTRWAPGDKAGVRTVSVYISLKVTEEAEWRKTHRRNRSVPAREDQERNSGRMALAVPPIEQPHVPCAPRAEEAVPAEESAKSQDARI
jgi:hypothetical protein